tara:strand:+ start:1302 stop:1748 length:447 start_codon:yes stop_codon:yes gene_type:complete
VVAELVGDWPFSAFNLFFDRRSLKNFFLTGYGLTRPFAGSGIGVRTLSTHWEASPVADSLETADLNLAFDVLGYIAPEITLNGVVVINEVSDFDNFFIGKIANSCRSADVESFTNIRRTSATDAVDIGQSNFHSFLSGNIYSCNTCHL